MFTGIITELGAIETSRQTDQGIELTIAGPRTVDGVAVGDSIAVNGVCLTVTGVKTTTFLCQAVKETLDRTTLGSLKPSDPVNLERPMAADGRFDGHVVQGHVDGVGTVLSCDAEGDAVRLRISLPDHLSRYVVEKGSIAVDGTSLTVTAVSRPEETAWFEIVVIPHTRTHTVFGSIVPGNNVNVETDIFAKYIERMTEFAP
jgi:riboflavin synthase